MKNRKGFTLIELLAVLVILGILLGIAVPKVSKYINNSRKEGFITEGKLFIKSVRNDATSEMYPLPIRSNQVTIITFDAADIDKAQNKSSFGGKYIYGKSYVAIINVGTGTDPDYDYYLAVQDSKGYAIPLTKENQITNQTIVANAKNKMEVTVQSLCGTEEGYTREFTEISGLNDVQPVDAEGNKISWEATIISGKGCSSTNE